MRQFQLRGAEHGSIRALGRLNWNPSVFFDPAGPDRTSSFFGGRASSFPRAGADCASSAATFLFSAVPKRRSWGPSVVPTGGTCVNSSHGGAEHGSIRALGRLNRSPSVFLDPAWPCRSSSFSEGRAFSFSLRRASSIQPNGLSLSRGAGADSARSPRAFSFSGVPKRRNWGPSVVPARANMRQFRLLNRGAEHGSIRALGRVNRSPSVFLDPAWPDRTSSFFGGRAFSFSLPPACSFFWRTSFLFFPVCRSGGTGVHPWSRPTNMRQFGFPTRGAGHASIRAPDW